MARANVDLAPGDWPTTGDEAWYYVEYADDLRFVADWTSVTNVFVDRLSLRVGPGVSEAQLSHEYGQKVEHADADPANAGHFQNVTAEVLVDRFVRIRVFANGDDLTDTPLVDWVGYCTRERDNRSRRRKTFTVRGLEWLLSKNKMTWAVCQSAKELEPKQRIGVAPTFNKSQGISASANQTKAGNKHIDKQAGRNDKRFTADIEDTDVTERWDAEDIVRYMLSAYPINAPSGKSVQFSLGAGIESLNWQRPVLDVAGRTYKQVLDSLADLRRLLVWYVEWDNDKVQAVVRVRNYNTAPLDLDGVELPETGDLLTIATNGNPTIDLQVTDSVEAKYNTIVAQGHRVGVCCTLSIPTGTLEEGWSVPLGQQYKYGVNQVDIEPDYATLNTATKKERNDRYRKSDAVNSVYSRYRIPLAWDGRVADKHTEHLSGIKGGKVTALLRPEDMQLDFERDDPQPGDLWVPGLRIERHLPLKKEFDYEKLPPTKGQLAGTVPQQRQPFAFMRTSDSATATPILLDQASNQNETENDGKRKWSARVAPHESSAAINLVVTRALPHKLAGNDWLAVPAGEVSDTTVEMEYTTLGATVFLYHQYHVAESWPKGKINTEGKIDDSVLYIDMPQFRLDYLVPGTVIEIKDGAFVKSEGGYIQDDRKQLRDIARLAYEFYATTRRQVSLKVSGFWQQFELGHRLTTIDNVAHNSMVTEIDYNFTDMSTTVSTNFAELDLEFLGASRVRTESQREVPRTLPQGFAAPRTRPPGETVEPGLRFSP